MLPTAQADKPGRTIIEILNWLVVRLWFCWHLNGAATEAYIAYKQNSIICFECGNTNVSNKKAVVSKLLALQITSNEI